MTNFGGYGGPSRSKSVTSIGLAPRPVGRAMRALFALLDDCFAIPSLRSGTWPRMFTNVHSDDGFANLAFGDVRQAFEQGREGGLGFGLGIGGGVLVAFPGQSEALGIEAA